ncbi:hypothetical protein C2845_PM11G08120 [Panicum miliaceum]|uniref:Uncharacterized protein n=1 Tax=Panicum miliaceum TaxID=4540 RepID=A0A3L6RUC9_PANMI|nr:hypothetical protein C2845_PM11G08120 [Panicum miliaceum]
MWDRAMDLTILPLSLRTCNPIRLFIPQSRILLARRRRPSAAAPQPPSLPHQAAVDLRIWSRPSRSRSRPSRGRKRGRGCKAEAGGRRAAGRSRPAARPRGAGVGPLPQASPGRAGAWPLPLPQAAPGRAGAWLLPLPQAAPGRQVEAERQVDRAGAVRWRRAARVLRGRHSRVLWPQRRGATGQAVLLQAVPLRRHERRAGVLPEGVGSMHAAVLDGPFVLQVLKYF